MSRKLNKMSDHHKPSIHIQERTGSVQLCKDFPHQMQSLSGCHGISSPSSPSSCYSSWAKALRSQQHWDRTAATNNVLLICSTARAAALGLWQPGLACCQIIKTVKSSNLTSHYNFTCYPYTNFTRHSFMHAR